MLIVVKLGAWWLTDSVSLLSSLVDSLLDVAASLVTLLAVRQALVPADREHRFGHGKAEPLAALVQSGLITGSAILVAIEAIQRLIQPEAVPHGTIGIAVMAVSILLTFALTRFQRYVVQRTGSSAIAADSLHYMSDLLMNGAVIVALVLVSQFGLLRAGPADGPGRGALHPLQRLSHRARRARHADGTASCRWRSATGSSPWCAPMTRCWGCTT